MTMHWSFLNYSGVLYLKLLGGEQGNIGVVRAHERRLQSNGFPGSGNLSETIGTCTVPPRPFFITYLS